jgi:hypothetical protein
MDEKRRRKPRPTQSLSGYEPLDLNWPPALLTLTLTGSRVLKGHTQHAGETELITIRVEDDFGDFDELVFIIEVDCTPPSFPAPPGVGDGRQAVQLYSYRRRRLRGAIFQQ